MQSSLTAGLGIDLGSTTVKFVLLSPQGEILARDYRRHRSAVLPTLLDSLEPVLEAHPGLRTAVRLTGSGALALSARLKAGFIQEVTAAALALSRRMPGLDAAVELGGEDAKLLYLTDGLELRMNEACAGGTGAFIDQMAALLNLESADLNREAEGAAKSHPVASRCGVFAKTDVVGLLNTGVPRGEIARSIFEAVAEQAIGGLSCGRPLRGKIAFLGGPLHFLPELKNAFERRLSAPGNTFVELVDGQYMVALGAAMDALDSLDALEPDGKEAPAETASVMLSDFVEDLRRESLRPVEAKGLPPLFSSDEERRAFLERHRTSAAPRIPLEAAAGPLFLGIDLGSTTAKGVLLTQKGEIAASWYESNAGAPLERLLPRVTGLRAKIPEGAFIRSICATGYGAELAAAALGAQFTEVETLAHQRAATAFDPEVSFVIDIGGQDMKCLKVAHGAITGVTLNEACSSGCGAFLETFAEHLGMSLPDFVEAAVRAPKPSDLGSRCTVFMNSRVRQAQRDGAPAGDIAAGLAVSVVKNALHKVLRLRGTDELGRHVVVQGGTFLNDAVLRAFEMHSGVNVVRPDIAGLMGAYGAALIARARTTEKTPPVEWPEGELTTERILTRTLICRGCSNHCTLTMHRFPSGRKFVSGNRCEFGFRTPGRAKAEKSSFIEWKTKAIFGGEVLSERDAPMGVIGIPRVLNMYEHYPFWRALFTELGFAVKLSGPSDRVMQTQGMETVPSQSLCLPAKLTHGHAVALAKAGVTRLWLPCIPKEGRVFQESDDVYACPVVGGYPEALRLNITDAWPGLKIFTPFLDITKPATVERAVLESFPGLKKADVRLAVQKAAAALHDCRKSILDEARKRFASGKTVVILAGRPYHLDPLVNHGIPRLIESMGAEVVTEDVAAMLFDDLVPESERQKTENGEKPLDVVNQWAFHARLYRAARVAAALPNVEFVQLVSFGCGIDAVTSEQVKRILEPAGKLHTMLKIDETDTLGAVKIRLRSLFAALEERSRRVFEKEAEELAAAAGPGRPRTQFESFGAVRRRLDLPASTEKPVRFVRKETPSPVPALKRTLYVPQMAPIHFPVIVAALRSKGFDLKLLPEVSDHALELGLRHVNNDACYPAIVVIGQLLEAVLQPGFDRENSALLLAQTCGPCRATNYPTLLKWALSGIGAPEVPVVTLSSRTLTGSEHLPLDLAALHRLMMGLVLGDVLQRALLWTEAREMTPGESRRVLEGLTPRVSSTAASGSLSEFEKTLALIVREFSAVPVRRARLPRVLVVGEILLQYHPKANLNLVRKIEAEGAEACLTDISSFILYCLNDNVHAARYYEGSKIRGLVSKALSIHLELLRGRANRAMAATHWGRMGKLSDMIEALKGFVSEGQQAGEGWLLTAEMIESLREEGANIVCLQPFACLPNHITGRGVMHALRKTFPGANLCSIDFEAGTAESNVANRLKLFLAEAKRRMREKRPA